MPPSPAETSGAPVEKPHSATTGAGLRLRISKKRLGLALAIALIADAVGAFVTLAPPLVWTLDVLTALLLFAVLGWQWLLLPGLVLEAIPGVSVAPLWLLVVVAVAVWGTARPKMWLRSEQDRR
jgi:hypothetical protein